MIFPLLIIIYNNPLHRETVHSGGVYHFENDDIGHRFKQNRNKFLFLKKGNQFQQIMIQIVNLS